VWSTPALIAGQLVPVAYNSSSTYYQYQTVTYNGGTYMLTVASSTGNPPSGTSANNSYWSVLAAPGEAGPPATPPAGFSTTINIATGTGLINLRTLANTAGYTGSGNATITYNVQGHRYGNAGTGAGGAGGVAIETGTWPSSTNTIALTLNVQSGIEVRGGGGGGSSGGPGGAGGDAINCQENLTITNSGAIRGGGGGGGAGAWAYGGGPFGEESIPGGGGGGGYPNGAGGTAGEGSYYYDPMGEDPPEEGPIPGNAGSAGTTGGGGSGGAGVSGYASGKSSGAGGNGGGAGAAGSNGAVNSQSQAGFTGGAAGYAVRKTGKTVTNATGTYSGTWA
jgi:hypothetical protein